MGRVDDRPCLHADNPRRTSWGISNAIDRTGFPPHFKCLRKIRNGGIHATRDRAPCSFSAVASGDVLNFLLAIAETVPFPATRAEVREPHLPNGGDRASDGEDCLKVR